MNHHARQLFTFLFVCLCICKCLYEYLQCVRVCALRGQKRALAPPWLEFRVKGSYVLSDVGGGNEALVLQRSRNAFNH